ncbi:hypothetical protein BB2000_2492 [Proteus mirabilis BB2000]|nr:hypothetical protein BB2000_2492 [Proteus mirabilis BB2000]
MDSPHNKIESYAKCNMRAVGIKPDIDIIVIFL